MAALTFPPDRPNREALIAALQRGVTVFCTAQVYVVQGSYPSQVDPTQMNIALHPENYSEMLRVQVDQAQRDTWFPDGRRYRVVLIEEGDV